MRTLGWVTLGVSLGALALLAMANRDGARECIQHTDRFPIHEQSATALDAPGARAVELRHPDARERPNRRASLTQEGYENQQGADEHC